MKTGQIEIALNKRKLTMLLTGSIAFVAIGLWFVLSQPKISNTFFGNPALIIIAGIVSILFFGFCAFFIFRKLQDDKAGLIINETGITDNASGVPAGHIPWKDIKEIKTVQVLTEKFLMILVINPNEYIDRHTNVIIRKTAKMNFKKYGTPISIPANTLKCNFDDLKKTLNTQLNNNKILQS